jgi:hypothetical protein
MKLALVFTKVETILRIERNLELAKCGVSYKNGRFRLRVRAGS